MSKESSRATFIPSVENADDYDNFDYLFGCESYKKEEDKKHENGCDCVQTDL
jgi:hypothetical protein